MNPSITLVLITACTVVALAAKQIHAKKGCDNYGYACYGGHGKRSLGSRATGIENIDGNELDDIRAELIVRGVPKESTVVKENSIDLNPKYRLFKTLKSSLNRYPKRLPERQNENDYPISSGETNRDPNNYFY